MKSLNIISILMSIQLCGAMVLANNIWEDDMEASGHEASTMDSEEQFMRTVIIQSTPATIITHADADVRQARRSDQDIENKKTESGVDVETRAESATDTQTTVRSITKAMTIGDSVTDASATDIQTTVESATKAMTTVEGVTLVQARTENATDVQTTTENVTKADATNESVNDVQMIAENAIDTQIPVESVTNIMTSMESVINAQATAESVTDLPQKAENVNIVKNGGLKAQDGGKDIKSHAHKMLYDSEGKSNVEGVNLAKRSMQLISKRYLPTLENTRTPFGDDSAPVLLCPNPLNTVHSFAPGQYVADGMNSYYEQNPIYHGRNAFSNLNEINPVTFDSGINRAIEYHQMGSPVINYLNEARPIHFRPYPTTQPQCCGYNLIIGCNLNYYQHSPWASNLYLAQP